MQAWPATIRGVYGDQERYEATYFAPYKGYYFSGDGARRDADGYYWITGAPLAIKQRRANLNAAVPVWPHVCV